MICLLICLAAAATFQSSIEKQRAAAEIQRASVRQQMQTLRTADCDAIPDVELTPLIDAAAQTHHLQTDLMRGVIEQESGKRPCAVSAKGAQGLMQLMPATADDLAVEDPFDPKQNIEGGATYLKQLLDRYKGNIKLALAAYNAGPAAVDQANGMPPIKETQDYVEAILKKIKAPDPPRPPTPKPTGN